MKIKKEKFIEKYYSMSILDLSKELGVSKVTINNYARKLNLKSKRTKIEII